MNISTQVLDKMIAAAESADHWLHDKLAQLKILREKLITFGAEGDETESDPLVGALRGLGE